MSAKLRVHVVILATLVAAQLPCAVIAASPQMEPVLKAIDPSQAQYDQAPAETPAAQSGAGLNQGGPINGAPVSGSRGPSLSRPGTPQLDQGGGAGTYPSELQIPEFGQPLPQAPVGQQPGPRDGGQSWATNQVVPAQPAASSADEARVAKLEQSAFGSTYPEHEVEDRIDHLEKEILGSRSTASIGDRLNKLEQKLGGGNSAFGSGGASPSGKTAHSGRPSGGGALYGAGSGGGGSYGGGSGGGGSYGGGSGGGGSYGGGYTQPPAQPVAANPYSAGNQAYNRPPANQYPAPNSYAGTGSGGTVAYSASQPPPQSSQYPQQGYGGGAYGANPGYPPQGYGGSSPSYPGYPQQYASAPPPSPPQYRATPYGNPYQSAPAYSAPPQTGYGASPYGAAPQAVYGAPQGLYPPYGVPAAAYPPATVAYAPPAAAYGAGSVPYGGGAYGYPPPGTGSASPQVANPPDFPNVIRNIPSDPRAGDYFGAIYKFAGGAVARWSKFPVKVHLPAGSPESWEKSLEGGVRKWGQFIPLKVAAANESADIEISWVNHLTPKLLGVTRLQVLKGHSQVQIFLLRPTYYLPEIPERTLQSAFLHELGHALGLFGHSDQPDDLMFATEIKPGANGKPSQVRYGNISPRDLNTIKKLYEAPAVPAGLSTERPLEWGFQADHLQK